ncbi:MAG: hypothetical protein QOJ23_5165, partial [Actinomycetota bacterium]|nr:hypothetical protein [Actinomycetota bacterium]
RFESLALRQPNSEVLSQTFGVLTLALHPDGYDWEFVPEAGQSFTDSGSDLCHWARVRRGRRPGRSAGGRHGRGARR